MIPTRDIPRRMHQQAGSWDCKLGNEKNGDCCEWSAKIRRIEVTHPALQAKVAIDPVRWDETTTVPKGDGVMLGHKAEDELPITRETVNDKLNDAVLH